jgi:hypothetical protein
VVATKRSGLHLNAEIEQLKRLKQALAQGAIVIHWAILPGDRRSGHYESLARYPLGTDTPLEGRRERIAELPLR